MLEESFEHLSILESMWTSYVGIYGSFGIHILSKHSTVIKIVSERFNMEEHKTKTMSVNFEQVRQHAISATTLASVIMSQIDEVSVYAPIAGSIAFLFAATGYTSLAKAAEGVVDALEEANVIDEELADKVEEIIDKVEEVIEENAE